MPTRRMSPESLPELPFAGFARGAPVRPRSRSPSPGHFCFLTLLGCFFNQSGQVHLQRAIAQGTCTNHNGQFPGACVLSALLSRKGRRGDRNVGQTFPVFAPSVSQSQPANAQNSVPVFPPGRPAPPGQPSPSSPSSALPANITRPISQTRCSLIQARRTFLMCTYLISSCGSASP